jgi:hypothetical protein
MEGIDRGGIWAASFAGGIDYVAAHERRRRTGDCAIDYASAKAIIAGGVDSRLFTVCRRPLSHPQAPTAPLPAPPPIDR